jgi:SlyX protein
MNNADSHRLDAPSDEGALSQRLTELEIKASFVEDTLDRLNDVVVRQQTQIDLLVRELMQLRQQANAGDAPAAGSLRDELPPHY